MQGGDPVLVLVVHGAAGGHERVQAVVTAVGSRVLQRQSAATVHQGKVSTGRYEEVQALNTPAQVGVKLLSRCTGYST